MLDYTCTLLLVGLLAALLGLDGVGAVAVQMAGILFVTEMVWELVIHLAGGRTAEAP
jgi:uncharacterized membrane protein YtjA (UPF0391 family)